MGDPKILISDLNGGNLNGERITEAKTVSFPEGIFFEIPDEYIDLQMEDNNLQKMRGRGTPMTMNVICDATIDSPLIDIDTKKKSTDNFVIRRIFDLMDNHRMAWSIIREINFYRHTKKKFLHFFVDLHDIIIPFKRELFDSRIEDIYMVYGFNENTTTTLEYFIPSDPQKDYQLILTQLLLLLFYLKSRKIEHRELGPSNIKVLVLGMKVQVSCLRSSCQSGGRRPNLEKIVDRLVLRDDVRALWYRPPEALLDCACAYEGTYDIWSVGCIFGKLLLSSKKTLFKGNNREEQQLDAIADILGDPTPEDVKFINDDDNDQATFFRTSVLQKTSSGTNKPPRPFPELMPDAEPVALDLLSKMLKFNPTERISVEDALKHDYVRELIDTDDVRKSLLTEIKEEYKYKGREEKQQTCNGDDREEKQQGNGEEHEISANDQEVLRKTLLREKFLFYNPKPFFLCNPFLRNPKPRKITAQPVKPIGP